MDRVTAESLSTGIRIMWPDKTTRVMQNTTTGGYHVVVVDKYPDALIDESPDGVFLYEAGCDGCGDTIKTNMPIYTPILCDNCEKELREKWSDEEKLEAKERERIAKEEQSKKAKKFIEMVKAIVNDPDIEEKLEAMSDDLYTIPFEDLYRRFTL